MFKRSASVEPQAPRLQLTAPSADHQLQGHLYCAARATYRAALGADRATDADHLFAALANLEDLARGLHVAEADLEEIARWKEEAEAKVSDLRRREQFQRRHPQVVVQMEVAPEPIEVRESA